MHSRAALRALRGHRPGDEPAAADVRAQRLERRLDRERRARREAEQIAESTTGALYDKQRELILLEAVATGSNEADTIDEALKSAIDGICAHTGWPVGHAYLRGSPDDELRSAGVWHLDAPELAEPFRLASERLTFPLGGGMPGRVVARGEPTWIEDLSAEDDFARREPARASGLTSAFCFPIVSGSQSVGVLEFFSAVPAKPDPGLLTVMGQVGLQLGRVVERQRARDELAVARDRALDASRMKSAFLANMSHELRTPLNGVIGMTELLLETGLDDAQRDLAGTVRSSGETLLSLIGDILDFEKLEAGKLTLERASFRPREVLDEVAVLMGEQARAKGLIFELRVGDAVPDTVMGDPGRLRQILVNLIGNGVKFTEHGCVGVEVRVAEDTPEDALVRFEVFDTGIGIDPARTDELFGAFSQADVSSTRAYGGTGLGLTISRHLAQMLGGEIGLRARPEGGSVFWFTARLGRVADAAAPANPVGDPEAAGQSGSEERAPRVLVVEDNVVNQQVAAAMVRKYGGRPEVAGDGREALALMENARFAAVLMDCQMPELDGYEATAEVRRREGTDHHTPIIAMTAHAMTGDRERCIAAGMDDYVSKPLRAAALAEVLDRQLGEQAGR